MIHTSMPINLDKQRQRRLIVTSGIVSLLALIDLPILLLASNINILFITIATVLVLVAGSCVFLAQKGYLEISSWMLIVTFLVAILFGISPTKILNSYWGLAYVLPIIVAGLISDYRMVLIVGGGLTVVSTIILLTQTTATVEDTAMIGVILLGITVLLWLTLRELHTALTKTVTLADDIQQAYEEVQTQQVKLEAQNTKLINANEDQRLLMETIQDLETPVLTLYGNVLVIPLIGHIDTRRSQAITERLLEAVYSYKARGIVIDISGVAVIDTQVIQHIIDLVRSIKLMGAQVVITGVKPTIAHTMVTLGVNFGESISAGSLQDGLQMINHSLQSRN